ncbi:hypothetical protein NMG60_11023228 [Bertholletia excelsa]
MAALGFHMSAGTGSTSYANNSTLQRIVMLKAWPTLEDTLKEAYTNFLVISKVINKLRGLALHDHREVPEFQIYLNDLPENDFNTIFKLLPVFREMIKEEKEEKLGPNCFVAGVPGSFYGRIFPDKSLNFIHSCYSLHWLSQVPEKLENKGNIYIAWTSPPEVFKAYLKQFQIDFFNFLSFRSEEIIAGGHLILTILGRSIADPARKEECCYWELLAKSLLELVPKGLVKEEDVDSFNLPFYSPYKDEVKAVVEKVGSLNLERLEVFENNWNAKDRDDRDSAFNKQRIGTKVANTLRAVTESMLASHFGASVLDEVFANFAKLVDDHPNTENSDLAGTLHGQHPKYQREILSCTDLPSSPFEEETVDP